MPKIPEVKSKANPSVSMAVIIVLGLLAGFDAMAIDMYLPSFAAIQEYLHTDAGLLQLSLSLFLLGFALGQAFFGLLIDSHGRKKPLLAGIAVFVLASIVIALSADIWVFMIGRFLQGAGGSVGMVIPRAIISDLYDARNATKYFTIIMQIHSVAPVVAPPLGGVLLAYLGWQAVFWILGAVGLLSALATVRYIPETLAAHYKNELTMANIRKSYGALCLNHRFVGMTMSASFISGVLFTYISASAFIFMEFYGLSATAYSFIFAANAFIMIAVGQLNIYLCMRLPLARILAAGFAINLVCTLLLLVLVLLGQTSLALVITLIFAANSSLSLLFGCITTEVMFSVPANQNGVASGVLGVSQYTLSGLAGIILSLLHDGSLAAFSVMLAVCSMLGFVCWFSSNLKYRNQTREVS